MYLITGAGGGIGSISRRVVQSLLDGGDQVRAMVRRDDDRADQLRAMGADVIVGDLTRAGDIVDAIGGVRRLFFNMSVSPDYLRATTEVCAVALDRGQLDVIVNMSQMTVSQMTLTSTDESKQHRLHWLAEHVLNWSRLPVIHVRPTTFLDNPLFTFLAKQAIRDRGVLALPFGTGRTSPISADDVARVVATLLRDPADRIGQIYELTGPEVLDINGLAEQYSRALNRPISAEDVPLDEWERQVL
ncbi:MAG TPA: NAD(P)H-binding protein, partial [Mycobacterium sp.]|nr:NAD(P)H-binding protein [Mycobacterium sp.]